MANLVECSGCSKQISKQAKACPSCGAPRKKSRVGMIVLLAIVGLGIVGAVGSADKKVVSCDSRVDARKRWVETPIFDVRAANNRGAAPRDYGYRPLGECSEKILSRQMTCDERAVLDTESDDPWLRYAAAIGFITYVCEPANAGDRVEFSIVDIMSHGRADAAPRH